MDQFIAKHADKLQGTLSCFDRVLFRGYLPFYSGYVVASFPDSRGIRRREVKRFVLTQAYRLKDHARQIAAAAGRPYQYFGEQSNSRYLNALAQVDDLTPGLRGLDAITTRKPSASRRPAKAFNPVARPDSQLFTALMSGEHAVHGFTNRDLRDKLAATSLRLRSPDAGTGRTYEGRIYARRTSGQLITSLRPSFSSTGLPASTKLSIPPASLTATAIPWMRPLANSIAYSCSKGSSTWSWQVGSAVAITTRCSADTRPASTKCGSEARPGGIGRFLFS